MSTLGAPNGETSLTPGAAIRKRIANAQGRIPRGSIAPLARAASLDSNYLSKVIHDKIRRPGFERAQRLAKILGLPMSALGYPDPSD